MKKKITLIIIGTLLVNTCWLNAQDGLFISEVADPADDYTGRFIELFNAGSEIVDFGISTFYLSRQSNGGTSWGEVQLTGTVAPGSAYVIGGSAFEAHYGFAPDLVTGILTGNGDDPYSLYEGGGHLDGMIHDIYGYKDRDGTGEAWEYTDSRAVRVESVNDPRILWSALEWEITPANIADCDPGTHNGSTPRDPGPLPGDFALAVLNDTVEAGHAIEVAVVVSELTGEDDIISYQFDIGYDETVMQYSYGAILGTLAEGGTVVDNEASEGNISISYMNTTPITGSGTILLLRFSSTSTDTTTVTISNAFLNNIPVTDLTGGNVFIVETTPPTADVFYSDSVNRLADMLMITANFSKPMDLSKQVLLSLTGAASLNNAVMTRQSDTAYAYLYAIPKSDGVVHVQLSNGTDAWGNEVVATPTSGEAFSIIPLRPGDVNDDGEIHAYDAALTLQHSVGLDPLQEMDPIPWENWRDSTANVDADGAITAYDAGLILQYSAGIIAGFARSARKGVENADISLEVENGKIIFYSHGNLVGLNISASDTQHLLGYPTILHGGDPLQGADECLTAIHTEESRTRIGLCTVVAPQEGSAILEIPFTGGGEVTFSLNVNGEQLEKTFYLETVVNEVNEREILVYPNPVSERLVVIGLTAAAEFRIYTIHGVEVMAGIVQNDAGGIDVGELQAGVYMISLDSGGNLVTRRFVVRQ